MSDDNINLIAGALDSLGIALTGHDHQWTDGERIIYESAIECVERMRNPPAVTFGAFANAQSETMSKNRGIVEKAFLRIRNLGGGSQLSDVWVKRIIGEAIAEALAKAEVKP